MMLLTKLSVLARPVIRPVATGLAIRDSTSGQRSGRAEPGGKETVGPSC